MPINLDKRWLRLRLSEFKQPYYTDHPEQMPDIYSALQQNIQDYCNQAVIEILSSTYTSIRDGNHSIILSNYLPADYTALTFQMRS